MLEEGVATRSDLLTVEVKLNEAKIALTKVDNGLTLSRMALAQLCGLPVNTRMELEDEQLQNAGNALPNRTSICRPYMQNARISRLSGRA